MLRDRLRETLARTEPGEREARDELQTILARSRGEVRPWWRTPLVALSVGVAMAIAIIVFVRKPAPPPVATDEAIHLYLHVDGEPVEKALTLDLSRVREPTTKRK